MPASTSSPGSIPVGAPFTWAAPAPGLTPLRLKSRSVVYALVPGRWAAEDVFSATAARMSAFKCLFINLVALMEIGGTPGVAFEAGVEEA
jgi:hypothetical protein